MAISAKERESMEKAMRYAFDKGQLVIPCIDKTAALSVRANFYTYFKTIARQARYKRDPEIAKIAKELNEIKENLSLAAYSNGELILTRRGRAQLTVDSIEQAMKHPDSPSSRDIMQELDEVDQEMLMNEVRRKLRMDEEMADLAPKPFVLTEKEKEEIEAMKKRMDSEAVPFKPVVLTRKELREGEMTAKQLWGEE